MYPGYPSDLVQFLRCPLDGNALRHTGTGQDEKHILHGTLRCVECRTEYAIADGIARLFDPTSLDSASRHEHQRRDDGAFRDNFKWETSALSQMEIVPTIESLRPLQGMSVLELGCGKGRLTTILARSFATVVAIDFSLAVLRKLASRIETSWRIALVQADCTRPAVANRSFHRALSTLISNLPTRDRVQAMYRVVADALTSDGKFVFDAHHYSLRQRIRMIPQVGQYPDSGIYRYMYRRDEIVRECGNYFEKVQCRPIQITLPWAGHLGFRPVALSRMAENIPLLNQLGELLLVEAERPRSTA